MYSIDSIRMPETTSDTFVFRRTHMNNHRVVYCCVGISTSKLILSERSGSRSLRSMTMTLHSIHIGNRFVGFHTKDTIQKAT